MALRRSGTWLQAVVLVAAWHGADAAQAASGLRVTAERVDGAGIVAREVDLALQPAQAGRLDLALYAARVDGLAAPGRLTGIRVECRDVAVSPEELNCRAGRLSGRLGEAGQQQTPLSLSLQADGRLHAALPALVLGGGRVAVEAGGTLLRWQATARFEDVDPGQLASLPPATGLLPEGLALAGRGHGTLQLAGAGTALRSATIRTSLAGLTFADAPGALAGEDVALEVDATLTRGADAAGWDVDAQLRAPGGQAYVEPVFLDFGARPVSLAFTGRLAADASSLAVSRFRFVQQGLGSVEGEAELAPGAGMPLRSATLRLQELDLAVAVPLYLGPFLVGTQFADVEGLGRVTGEIGIREGLPEKIALELEGVSLDSVTGAIAVEGLAGRFSWFDDRLRDRLARESDSAIFKSLLSWQAARLWGLELGPAALPFTTTGRHFRLLDPVLIPLFDGGLAVETLRIRHAGEPDMYLRFDAELRPISVARLTRALGWPEFQGTISGRIPRLELADGLVTLGGNIEARVFDGNVTVRNLRMRDPLGASPQLFADIEVERLDLEQLTSTFEFGMITGRLSGYVKDLETFDWSPVAFDASFYSTPGDPSPRRIDQRAVSNLSRIGGGSGGSVAAALQGGFLRFFDSFRYRRLGLSCRLENDVCRMDGVEPAQAGYYIVKGSGLPRIDVIGSQRRVAWSRLLRQLAGATSAGLVIE